jgi:hypothetical protein
MFNTTLCIPKVQLSITREDIEKVFNSLNLGKIVNITFKNVTYHKTNCNRVYISFGCWNNKMCLEHLQNGNTLKIFYDKPRFWICSLASY